MTVEYAMLSRIVNYLRMDEDIASAILQLKEDDYYFYDIVKQNEQIIQVNNHKVYQFHYCMMLPSTYFEFHVKTRRAIYTSIEEPYCADFLISCITENTTSIDNECIKYFHKNSKLEKDGLSALLLIMSLPNWHIGIYQDNKGEKQNK